MVTKLLMLMIASEAIVELWKKAGPLRGVKEWIIGKTPFLYSNHLNTHLLECPYCLSLWAGYFLVAAYLFMDYAAVFYFVVALVIHRLSNFFHLMMSIIRDYQLDLRVKRNKL